MFDFKHPVIGYAGLILFLLCTRATQIIIDKLTKRIGTQPILFSVHGSELKKRYEFVKALPKWQKIGVRSLALAGMVFLALGFWLGKRV